jgi:hypothetical protein
VCISCLKKDIDKKINMGEKNPSCAKLVQNLRQKHLSDGVYKAFKAVEKVPARDAVKWTPNKMCQSPIMTFRKNNQIFKDKIKMLVAKCSVATNQPLNAGESTHSKT